VHPLEGIRFKYGDLADVVTLLARHPYTRQAYLPVWFPEDTGARDGGGKDIRVPCSLGYHFMIRDGELSCRYYLRSCDLYRHFSNDIYMTARLVQWMCGAVQVEAQNLSEFGIGDISLFPPVKPGRLLTVISSLHLFVNDVDKMKARINRDLS
jgi:thymidylate synthase